MKTYDFHAVHQFIETHKEHIAEVMLGLKEDWFWTAETVFANGEYKVDLTKVDTIANLNGSQWATPCMWIEDKEGNERMVPVFKGESTEEKPTWLTPGCLSGPCQNWIDTIFGDVGKVDS